jgi:hypothetical protein
VAEIALLGRVQRQAAGNWAAGRERTLYFSRLGSGHLSVGRNDSRCLGNSAGKRKDQGQKQSHEQNLLLVFFLYPAAGLLLTAIPLMQDVPAAFIERLRFFSKSCAINAVANFSFTSLKNLVDTRFFHSGISPRGSINIFVTDIGPSRRPKR